MLFLRFILCVGGWSDQTAAYLFSLPVGVRSWLQTFRAQRERDVNGGSSLHYRAVNTGRRMTGETRGKEAGCSAIRQERRTRTFRAPNGVAVSILRLTASAQPQAALVATMVMEAATAVPKNTTDRRGRTERIDGRSAINGTHRWHQRITLCPMTPESSRIDRWGSDFTNFADKIDKPTNQQTQ